jgi:hypothetical protein
MLHHVHHERNHVQVQVVPLVVHVVQHAYMRPQKTTFHIGMVPLNMALGCSMLLLRTTRTTCFETPNVHWSSASHFLSNLNGKHNGSMSFLVHFPHDHNAPHPGPSTNARS